MKRACILLPVALFIVLACSVIPVGVAPSRATLPPPIAASAASLPMDELPTPDTFAEEENSDLQAVTVSPQPAVARFQPGTPITLDRIAMVDALNGWAVSGGDVLFTADGAQTWREATPPEVLSPGSQVEVQGTFLDAQHAWVIFSLDRQTPPGGVVWRTDDSGQTWTPGAALQHEAFGDKVWAEFFALDAMHLWLIVRGVYAGAGTHYAAQFLRSTDGGFTWSPLVGDVGVDYTGFSFADPSHGLLTWETTGAYAPSPPEYAVTTDGAITWDVRPLPPPADAPDLFEAFAYCESFQPRMLSAQSMHLLVGCFDVHDPPEEFRSYLYSSQDGGMTWKNTRLPEKILAAQAALFFFGGNNVLLLGRDIYRSTDGGQSWEYVKSVSWEGQFTFVDPQTGWAIARANGETALVKTSNGGGSWTEIRPVIAP